MGILEIAAIIAGIVGFVAGIAQIADYAEKRRAKTHEARNRQGLSGPSASGIPSRADDMVDLVARARSQSKRTVSALSAAKKYVPELYANRVRIEDEFEQFLSSDKVGYALIGGSGMGKTNLFCHLAQNLGSSNLLLFYNGSFLRKDPRDAVFDLKSQIARDLNLATDGDVYLLLGELSSRCAISGYPMIVLIDAINEYEDPIELLRSISEMIGTLMGSKIKVAFSCRDHVWNYLYKAKANRIILYENAFFNFGDGDTKGSYLTEFTEFEIEQAYRFYEVKYDLKSSYSTLSEQTTESCKNPLMLRLTCEVYRGQVIPPNVPQFTVFEMYYRAKLGSDWDLESFLEYIALSMRTDKMDQLARPRVLNELQRRGYRLFDHSNPYHNLLDESIVYESGAEPEVFVKFTYDKFFEYVLSRKMLTEDVLANLSLLAKEAESFDSIRGALENVVLFYEQRADSRYLDVLRGLADETNQSWKEFACLTIPKLSQVSTPTIQMLLGYAMHTEYWVRWAASSALREIFRKRPAFLSVLTDWSDNENWQVREAVANALAGVSDNPVPVMNLLHGLAKDEHWRVRRVVAFTVGEIVETYVDVMAGLLTNWIQDSDWRVREALARSPRSTSKTHANALSLLTRLVNDPQPIVRRATAKSLGMIAQAEPKSGLEMLVNMSGDENWWVRKTVVKALDDFAELFPETAIRYLNVMAEDLDYGVRWAVARSLRKFAQSDHKEALKILLSMTGDGVQQVAEAAIFSIAVLTDANPESVAASMLPGASLQTFVNEQIYESAKDTSRLRASKPKELTKKWVRDEYLSIQTAIASLVGSSGDESYLGTLRKLASDEDEGIRWGVANIIGEIGTLHTGDALALLELMSHDRHYWIRRAVVESVENFAFQDADSTVRLLKAMACDESEEVRQNIAKSSTVLASILPAEGLAILSLLVEYSESKADRADNWARKSIVEALAQFGAVVPDPAFELIRMFFDETNQAVTRALARALERFGEGQLDESMLALQELASCVDKRTQEQARQTLSILQKRAVGKVNTGAVPD